jgi:hypothetical protein
VLTSDGFIVLESLEWRVSGSMEECALAEMWRGEMQTAVWCGVEEDFGLLVVNKERARVAA